MINGIEGIPGSGKSYEATVFHVLPSLQKGRLVITNLPLLVEIFTALDPAYADLIELRTKSQPVLGIWDAEGMDDSGNGEAFKVIIGDTNFEPIKNVSVFGSVWDYYSPWKHPKTGSGPLYIIDECHLGLPAGNTTPEVVEWYKLHRHFNADVLLMTQSFRDINQPIARLLGMLIRCRKADILGRKDCYIRKVHAGYRGAVISTEERKYQPQFFGLYRSHTQGNSVAESIAQDVAPLSVKLQRFTRGFWLFTIIVAVVVGMWIYDRKKTRAAGVTTTSTKTVSVGPPPGYVAPAAPAGGPPRAAASAPGPGVAGAPPAPAAPDLEPLLGKMIHITGWMRSAKGAVYTFAVSGGGARLFTLVVADLLAAGYTWKPLGECMGYLTFEGKTRSITCDAPRLASGSDNAPVVMDLGTAKRSDGPAPL